MVFHSRCANLFPNGKMTSVSTPDAAEFGAAVLRARSARSLTQEDVALAAGVGLRFIHDLEHGKVTVELDRALRVAAAVGMKVIVDDGSSA